jgi:hypothetical protein
VKLPWRTTLGLLKSITLDASAGHSQMKETKSPKGSLESIKLSVHEAPPPEEPQWLSEWTKALRE